MTGVAPSYTSFTLLGSGFSQRTRYPQQQPSCQRAKRGKEEGERSLVTPNLYVSLGDRYGRERTEERAWTMRRSEYVMQACRVSLWHGDSKGWHIYNPRGTAGRGALLWAYRSWGGR